MLRSVLKYSLVVINDYTYKEALQICLNSRLKFKSGAVYLTTYDKICYFSRVEGPSMKPLINSGSKRNFVLVIRPIANLFGVPPMETILKRGDVVSVVSPKNPSDCFLKRVIGLPGDIVETITYKRKFVRVPDGHCWIEGDNFRVSHDSNEFGCVPLGLVSGQAKLIIYPLSDLSKIESKLPNHRKIKKRLANDDNERETFIIGFKSNKQKDDEDDDDDDEEDDEDVDDSDDKTDDKNY